MQPSTATSPSPRPRSFAGVLADLAAPEAKFPPARELPPELLGLEEDFATLTYETALRRHGRYRSEAPPVVPSAELPEEQPIAAAAPMPSNGVLRRKSASITIRLTQAEGDTLRKRASESGLTLSEYLRSCVMEVEQLRAQVKEAVASLRAAESAPQAALTPWWKRVFLPRRSSRQLSGSTRPAAPGTSGIPFPVA